MNNTKPKNQALEAVLSKYEFEPVDLSGNKWECVINNDSNCQSTIFLHLLTDEQTVRLSIASENDNYINSIDMFETTDMNKISQFMDLIQ